ncbi:MAG TPA: hypothetical protein VH540_21225 [Ktedonobacterales bacterium]|jgi:hypothetical protein
MTLETGGSTMPKKAPAMPWSKPFVVYMFLVVCLVSPLFGGAAAYLSLKLFMLAQGQQVWFFCFVAAFASLLVGPFFWWLIVIRPRHLTAGSGAWVGVAGSLSAHPLTWLLAFGISYLTGSRGVLFLEPGLSGLPTVFLSAVFYSYFSLIYVGWLTTPIGALAGAGAGWVLARLAERDKRRR